MCIRDRYYLVQDYYKKNRVNCVSNITLYTGNFTLRSNTSANVYVPDEVYKDLYEAALGANGATVLSLIHISCHHQCRAAIPGRRPTGPFRLLCSKLWKAQFPVFVLRCLKCAVYPDTVDVALCIQLHSGVSMARVCRFATAQDVAL